ncbi:hypothetical protein KTN05_15150 [Paracoccus sp. Z118]|uniref:hypothetical protein n=1 Tax=Paracoccus sp. Z118 TaxID=2851017 RepID=UPI001C2B8C7D|nr:hypothetical protein [Paracoccus sp. Z118]MBV0893151.1 hypothetical protein [Paracoccus sp. Z118]
MTIETYRAIVMDSLANSASFQGNWAVHRPAIMAATGNLTNAGDILGLGSHLSRLFELRRVPNNRNNAAVSQAGRAWEDLVITYLNIVFSGTNAIAMRTIRAHCPQVFRDATSIWYGNAKTNTEADVCVAIFPEDFQFPVARRGFINRLNQLIGPAIHNIRFGIVQCKTNWNDNAQIPMLWDMVYRANHHQGQGVVIGTNGYNIGNFLGNRISYSFVTVPTQNSPILPNSMPVNRVAALSGGNFWGRPSVPNVAQSISEIFNRNFRDAFAPNSVVASITQAINAGYLAWVHAL